MNPAILARLARLVCYADDTCPACGTALTATDTGAVATLTCPACGLITVLPAEGGRTA